MTKETRLENVKKVKDLGDKQKIHLRSIRQDHLKLIKKALKDDPGLGKDAVTRTEKEVEKEIKSALEEVDKIAEQVKKDIMAA
jgi:ribosome recycling factor